LKKNRSKNQVARWRHFRVMYCMWLAYYRIPRERKLPPDCEDSGHDRIVPLPSPRLDSFAFTWVYVGVLGVYIRSREFFGEENFSCATVTTIRRLPIQPILYNIIYQCCNNDVCSYGTHVLLQLIITSFSDSHALLLLLYTYHKILYRYRFRIITIRSSYKI